LAIRLLQNTSLHKRFRGVLDSLRKEKPKQLDRSEFSAEELAFIDLYHRICLPTGLGFLPVTERSEQLDEVLETFTSDFDVDEWTKNFREAVECRREVLGQQVAAAIGPGRASRAMAIVHIAIFDAVNAITGGYTSYTGVEKSRGSISMDAAISQAAHDTLVALYPSQATNFNTLLANDLAKIYSQKEKANGIMSPCEETTARRCQNLLSALTISRATYQAIGGRTRSA
jgi:hypothetical protein